MPAYILTGAPGAGKTAVLRLLETMGYVVVEEAATDIIALDNALGCEEPWRVLAERTYEMTAFSSATRGS